MRALLLASCLLALTSCIPLSLKPLTDGSDSHFDPKYVGTWGDGGGNWELTGGSPSVTYDEGGRAVTEEYTAYDVYFTEAGKSSELLGQLTTIDGVDFLDLTPQREISTRRGNEDIGGKYIELMLSLPLHTWVKIEVQDGKLEMTPVDADFMEKLLEESPAALPHLTAEEAGWPIITATTEQLRTFIAQHMHDEGFFGEKGSLAHLGLPASHGSRGPGIQSGNSSYDSQYRSQTAATKPAASTKKKSSRKSTRKKRKH